MLSPWRAFKYNLKGNDRGYQKSIYYLIYFTVHSEVVVVRTFIRSVYIVYYKTNTSYGLL